MDVVPESEVKERNSSACALRRVLVDMLSAVCSPAKLRAHELPLLPCKLGIDVGISARSLERLSVALLHRNADTLAGRLFYLCANGREVTAENLSNFIPVLPKRNRPG